MLEEDKMKFQLHCTQTKDKINIVTESYNFLCRCWGSKKMCVIIWTKYLNWCCRGKNKESMRETATECACVCYFYCSVVFFYFLHENTRICIYSCVICSLREMQQCVYKFRWFVGAQVMWDHIERISINNFLYPWNELFLVIQFLHKIRFSHKLIDCELKQAISEFWILINTRWANSSWNTFQISISDC